MLYKPDGETRHVTGSGRPLRRRPSPRGTSGQPPVGHCRFALHVGRPGTELHDNLVALEEDANTLVALSVRTRTVF